MDDGGDGARGGWERGDAVMQRATHGDGVFGCGEQCGGSMSPARGCLGGREG